MDSRSFHNHGDWQGPCGDGRHALLVAGGPPDAEGKPPRSASERAAYTLLWTRRSPEGLRCACCRQVLLEPGRAATLEADATRTEP